LIDIGINFTDKAFSLDIEHCIHAAEAAGVSKMIVTGTTLDESHAALALTEQYSPQLYSTAGVHPHYAKQWQDSSYQTLKKLAAHTNVVAIGETGLDFNRDFSPRPQQEQVFHYQLQLASELQKPVFLHERDAFDRQHAILSEHINNLSNAVIHCFTGSKQALFGYLDLGLHIGITGWVCDERRGKELQELVKLIPEDRLMIETDGPYLLPRDLNPKPKSRRNEPKYLAHIATTIAAIRGESVGAFGARTHANALRFFNLSDHEVEP